MEYEQEYPVPEGKLNERIFCRQLMSRVPMAYESGSFFTRQGRVRDEQMVRQLIYESLEGRVTTGIHRKVESILGVLKLEAGMAELPLNDSQIHLANGVWQVGEGFREELRVCRFRLPVRYDPGQPKPTRWLRFLDSLLEPEDILTLQEFMGYCLIPTNIGQKMLIITGRGGEGKSRIGVVMRALLGDNMNQGSLYKLETNQFARADLEHKLLLVDDDLNLSSLPSTHYLKTITTAENAMDLERKGIQSYQGNLYCRLMAFGNGSIRCSSDNSYGFYRRQIILHTKTRDPNRVDDPYLGKRLAMEAEGILLWCLEGLNRLFENDFQFTESKDSRENFQQIMEEDNHLIPFLRSQGYFLFSPGAEATTRAIYAAYRDWCQDNSLEPQTAHKFSEMLRLEAQYYGLQYNNNVDIGSGRRARGYRGIKILR